MRKTHYLKVGLKFSSGSVQSSLAGLINGVLSTRHTVVISVLAVIGLIPLAPMRAAIPAQYMAVGIATHLLYGVTVIGSQFVPTEKNIWKEVRSWV